MLPYKIVMRRGLCFAKLVIALIAGWLSIAPWICAAAQDAPVQLPVISVTNAPPSKPSNQGSGDVTVVSPTTVVTPSEQSPSSVTVITADDIAAQQRLTVPDALAAVPGLNVVQQGGPGSLTSVFIRGTNANQVKVLIDGIDMSDPSNSDNRFDFGQLLTGDIARIEVLRGPQSGLYGSEAIGGVISITTKSGSGPPKVTLSAEGGSFGTTNERASLSGSQANFNYVFNVQHFQSASTPVTPTYDLAPGEQRNNDFYDNWTYSTKLGYNFSDNLAVNVVGRYTESNLRFTNDDFNAFPAVFAEPIQSTQLAHQFYGRGEVVWSPVAGFKNFFGVNYTNVWSWNFDPNPDNFTNPLIIPPAVNLGTRINYNYRGELQVAPGQLLLFGAEDQNETLRTNSSSSFDSLGNEVFFLSNAERRNDAGWLELQSQLTQQFYLVSNVRYDANEDFGDHTTFRVAPVYLVPTTGTKLFASYGTGFKAPSLQQLFLNVPAFFQVANPNLKPEESSGWDVGFEQPIANNSIRFGSTYFRNDIKNLIQGVFTPVAFTWENIGVASTFGTENFAAWQVSRDLSLRADYTYTVAKDDITGQQLLRRPKNKASLRADWLATDRLLISSTLLYVGPWWDINRSGTESPIKAPGFTTLNLAANYALRDDVTLFARIDNLFNKHYEDPLGFLRPGFGVFGGVRFTAGGTPSGNGLPNTIPAANTPPPAVPSARSQGVM